MTSQPVQTASERLESIIHRVLPHRYPFLLIDRVTSLTPGVEIRGVKTFSANEAMLTGFCPSSAAIPTGILLEAVTQLGAILVLERPEMAGKIAMILQIPSAHVYRFIKAGDTVRLKAKVLKLRETLGELRGEAYLENELIAEGRMRFAIADRSAVLEA